MDVISPYPPQQSFVRTTAIAKDFFRKTGGKGLRPTPVSMVTRYLPIFKSPPESIFLPMLATLLVVSYLSPIVVSDIILWSGAVPTYNPRPKKNYLTYGMQYDVDVQACIPTALCALHNFNYSCDENEEDDSDITLDTDDEDERQLWPGTPVGPQVAAGSATLRDDIAVAMWNDYQAILVERAQRSIDSDSGSDFFEEEVASTL
ncbi:hypothetical protein PISMIDRAFT_19486 [Pisolithus microcarpus 441]|uniref:Uncharacterized protein n=1 Tax=Pisolithus microcarpus 441 TaxID=765257 RepID=A0A0C9Y312_9AGAM|nr:hypothetical protein PISMIDRAFT_19486 [Pisolithus microcarpus 441]